MKFFEEAIDLLDSIRERGRKHPLSILLFLLLCSNVFIAPAVYAASGGSASKNVAYAIGLLCLVTLGLSVYLFVVIFQPERF